MATGYIELPAGVWQLPDGSTTNLAPGTTLRQGTQTGAKGHFLTIDFDGGGNVEGVRATFNIPGDYASGGSLLLSWMANTTTAQNVKWQAEVAAVTAADADTPLEHAYAAAATVTTGTNTTEANRLIQSTITLTMDSTAANDVIQIYLFRDSADVADTCTVDAAMISATFSYTTT